MGNEICRPDTYYLYENGHEIAHSKLFEVVLNKSVETEYGMICYNNVLVWKQDVSGKYDGK